MTPTLLELLRSVDTPTVCNAIEVAQGKRGFNDFTRGTVQISDPSGVVVGKARTAKIAAKAPSTEDPAVIRERRMAYYKYMSEGTDPSVVVIEDEDGADAVGAFWGELNTTVHKAFGLAGVLTNGVMRDLGDMAPDFPVVAGSVGPSHAFVRVTDLNSPVTVFGMTVHPDDWVHADRHGAVVIPADLIPQLEDAIHKTQATERIVLDATKADDFDFSSFEAAWSAFENART